MKRAATALGGALGLLAWGQGPGFTEAEAKHGEAVYKERCAACHGAALDGGQESPPLTGGEFWSQFEGKPARALYARILSSMPPDSPGSLKEREAIDLVAFIARTSSIPVTGGGVADPSGLNAIVLQRPK